VTNTACFAGPLPRDGHAGVPDARFSPEAAKLASVDAAHLGEEGPQQRQRVAPEHQTGRRMIVGDAFVLALRRQVRLRPGDPG
jgi:hypothetical protein